MVKITITQKLIIDGHSRWNAIFCPGKYFSLEQMIKDAEAVDNWKYEAIDRLAAQGIITGPEFWREHINDPMQVWGINKVG